MKKNGIKLFIQDIENELKKIDIIVNNIIELQEILKGQAPDKFYITSFAGFLYNFYSGIEIILLRIAKKIDKDIPIGINWHKDLINHMSYETEFRPYVVTTELKEQLLEYLNFRHFFRHSYTYELKWEKIKPLLKNIKRLYNDFKIDLKRFLNLLTKV